MDAREKERLLADLARGRQAVVDAVRGVHDDTAARIPSPGAWSILECVEHLAVSEDYLLSQILASTPSEIPAGNREREARILESGMDRTRAVPAPDVGKPRARFATLDQALQSFLTIRDRTVQFVENCQEDLRAKLTTHPLIGPANCHEMLLMIAVHPHRHAGQIAEIRQHLERRE